MALTLAQRELVRECIAAESKRETARADRMVARGLRHHSGAKIAEEVA